MKQWTLILTMNTNEILFKLSSMAWKKTIIIVRRWKVFKKGSKNFKMLKCFLSILKLEKTKIKLLHEILNGWLGCS